MKRMIVTAAALMVAAALAAAVWWYAKDHVRVGRAELEQTVARKAGGQRAVCVARAANGSSWLCVAIGTPGPLCLRAHVRPWGSVELHQAYLKCAANATLARYVSTASSP
jgi:hypothetical protein